MTVLSEEFYVWHELQSNANANLIGRLENFGQP